MTRFFIVSGCPKATNLLNINKLNCNLSKFIKIKFLIRNIKIFLQIKELICKKKYAKKFFCK